MLAPSNNMFENNYKQKLYKCINNLSAFFVSKKVIVKQSNAYNINFYKLLSTWVINKITMIHFNNFCTI